MGYDDLWAAAMSHSYCSVECHLLVKQEEFADEMFERVCQACSQVRKLSSSERHHHRLGILELSYSNFEYVICVLTVLPYQNFRLYIGCHLILSP